MEKAHLRELKQTGQCELVFHLQISNENKESIVDEEIHSVRSCTDVIESLLTHTERKISKILQTKNSADIKVETSLTVNGLSVEGDINCKEFIDNPKENLVFSILNQQFEVVINAPLVQDLALPKTIHVDYTFQPVKFKTIYTNRDLSDFIWYTSEDKGTWTEVGNKFKYKPTIKDVNKYVKLKCVPKNNCDEGPLFEVVSQTVVSAMSDIPVCPFEARHEYTKTFLKEKHEFRIVTYNVLSNLYAENHVHPDYCSPQALSIDYRKQLILKELLGYNADIICLQEVDLHIFSHYFKQKLFKTYKGLFYKKGNKIPEGLACFFNVSRFKLLETHQLVFSDELKINPLFSQIWNIIKKYEELTDTLIRQKTSLQITVLRAKDVNEIVIVANTHLYYHPDACQIRLLQAYMALAYINDVSSRYKRQTRSRVSVIFCGDFNSVPTSVVYDFIVNGQHVTTFSENNEPVTPKKLDHAFKLASACGTPKYTNYAIDFKGCLDYIFYDKKNFKVIDSVPLPDEKLLEERTALPNEVFPSDHLALISTLKWT